MFAPDLLLLKAPQTALIGSDLRRSVRRYLVVLLALVSSEIAVSGQSRNDAVPEMPRASLGVSFGFATKDSDARMRLYDGASAVNWMIDGGIGLGSRVGAGIEYSRPRTLTGSTVVGVGRTQIVGRQVEHVAVGVLRGRVAGRGAWALDVVGGAGVLVHHHFSGGCTPPKQPRTDCPADRSALYGKAPAIVAGVDVPVQPAGHFAVVFQPRYYVLRRGDNPTPRTFQVEHHSSTRFAMNLGARLLW